VNTSTSERRDRLGAFFAANATRLHNAVRAAARGPEAVIEDACQVAWTILVRRPDISLDERGFNWLAIVAIREAWRLASIANEIPVGSLHGTMTGHDEELPEPAHLDDRSAEQRALDHIEHHERLAVLATLKPREREALYLLGLGHSYAEIADLSGVNRCRRRLPRGAVR
jgi:DNA-directed RNA polymerase specialized sigma24 family protein